MLPINSANTSATTSADITEKALNVTATASNKVYDGASDATVSLSDNRVAGDSLSTTYSSASFADKNVGNAKTVNISGIAVSGTDAANYSANATASTTANITARALSITATGVNKVYDGTTSATVTLADNRLVGDSLSISYTSASFANKNVGTAKTINVTGISITGTDAANYSANTTATGAADITARTLTISATGVNKVYDGTTTATAILSDNRVPGDSLSASSTTATFANKNVGNGKTVTVSGITVIGTDAGNYIADTTATTSADITTKGLTVSGVTANNKVYDGTTAATLSTNVVAFAGVIGAEAVYLVTNGYIATFASANIGTNIAVMVGGLTIGGLDATNYTLAQPTDLTANITASALTVTGITANGKAYDGTTTAMLNLSGATLNGVASGDAVTLNTVSAAGTFADANVGTGKTVTVSGLALVGPDAPNYTLTQPTTTANITTATLSVAGVTANDKVYDGTTAATLDLAGAALVGAVSGDEVTLNAGSATALFADANAGTSKPVAVTGCVLSGSDAVNYTLAQPAGLTANITQAGTTNLVTSSANPSLSGANITFTASLTAVAPGAGTLTGAVQFRTNGIGAGEPVVLSNGIATFSTGLLSLGTNSITVEYVGDANFTGSTNSLNPPQVITEPLVAGTDIVGAFKNHSVTMKAEKLLANDAPVTLAGVSANSTNGGSVTLSDGLVTYTPAPNFIGADLFTYTISDGFTTATGSVHVVVADTGSLALNRIGDVVLDIDGAHARFAGIPGFTYTIERSTDGIDWTAVGSVVVPANGLFELLDSDPPSGSVFYRTTVP